MKYLVTGGLGFIGSHFIECLLKDSDTDFVLNVDSGSYAADKNFRPSNGSKYELLLCDIGNTNQMKRLNLDFDVVVNFASHSHVDKSISNPQEFVENNIKSFFNFLEVCKFWKRRGQIKKFVHISTDEVFGDVVDSEELVFCESSPLKPSSAYSASKAAQEMFIHSARKMFNFPANILRLCNNFGPRQFEEKFIPTIIRKLCEGEMVPVYGDGSQSREWMYVKDAVRKIKLVGDNLNDTEDYCIGSGTSKTNLELVHQINCLTEKQFDPIISFVADRIGHDRDYKMDSSKFNLNYKSDDTPFKRAIKETVDHYYGKTLLYTASHEQTDLRRSHEYS